MKKILSIISAGLLVVLAASCNKDEKATFDPSDVTAPVLGTVNVGSDIVVNYTPAVFSMDFNQKLNTYHTLGMVAVNDEKCDVTLSNAKDNGASISLKGKNLTAALELRGFEMGESVKVAIVVRASIQDPSKGVTNGYTDSEDSYEFNWTLKEDKPTGLPTHDGVRVYVDNQSGWGESLTLYQWGDVNNFGGDWPGSKIAGTESLGGIDWVYFEYGNDIFGLAQHLIFSNNGSSQLADYDITFEEGVADYWLKVTPDGVEAAEEPAVGGGDKLPDVDLTGLSENDVLAGAETWGVIGPAAIDWSTDVDFEKVSDEPEVWKVTLELKADKFKFRGNDTWGDYDLGGGTFALDTAMELSKGGGDMSCPEEGTYTIYLWPTYMLCYITK